MKRNKTQRSFSRSFGFSLIDVGYKPVAIKAINYTYAQTNVIDAASEKTFDRQIQMKGKNATELKKQIIFIKSLPLYSELKKELE